MNAQQVKQIVEAEIRGEWTRTNLHHVNLRVSLLETPEMVTAIAAGSEQEVQVWLVLVECPGDTNTYGVAYSEQDSAFGLIQFAEGYEPCLLGIYGGFWETFDAM